MFFRKRKTVDTSLLAVIDAKTHSELIKAKNPDVYSVGGELRRQREQNHFADQLYAIFAHNARGGPNE